MDVGFISALAVVLFLLGTPILLVLGVWVAAVHYFVTDYPLINIAIGSVDAVKSFVFLAVPLFVASGDLLTEGGVSRKLVAFARAVVRVVPGATASSAMFACGLFSAVSGSNAATTATIGRVLAPEMTRIGIAPGLAASLIASGGTVGIIIPPSVLFIVYGVTMNVSSVELFVAGIIPGLLLVCLLLACAGLLTRHQEPALGWRAIQPREVLHTAKAAWIGFGAMALIFFGLYFGVFSPTEAGAIVALYCMATGVLVTRELGLSQIRTIFIRSASVCGMLVPLAVFSVLFQQMTAILGLPELLQGGLESLGVTYGATLTILVMMLIILAVGAITESIAVVLILGPILGPVAIQLGVDPIHWGVVFVLGTSIGFVTPPYGLNIFVACGVCNVSYEDVVKQIWKPVVALLTVWLLVTFLPWTTQALLR